MYPFAEMFFRDSNVLIKHLAVLTMREISELDADKHFLF